MVNSLAITVDDVTLVFLVHYTDEFTTYYIDFLIEGEFVEGRVLVTCSL